MNRSRLSSRRLGFTLMEALVATAVTATVGTALLLSTAASLETAQQSIDQTIAAGIAEQRLDEIAGARYCAPGANPRAWPLGPEAGEGPLRASLNDIDDYAGRSEAIADPWGVALGQDDGAGQLRHASFRVSSSLFQHWHTQTDVFYVSAANFAAPLAAGQTSDHRAVRVRVLKTLPGQSPRVLAELQRVFSYVPPQ